MKSSNLLSYRVTKTVEHPSGYDPIAHLPSVDVVIPTFNSEDNLKECLRRIQMQRYKGNIRIWIIDGGSTDGTITVAREFSCEIHVNPGQYGTGRNGARHFGASLGKGDLIWNIDSDNFIEEVDCLRNLVTPFLDVPDLTVSAPLISVPNHGGFDSWLAYQERWFINRLVNSGSKHRGYSLLGSPDYGLTNSHLIKRSVYEVAGGYDGDTHLLARLKGLGLSKTAIVSNSHYIHRQTGSLREVLDKWSRRANMYSSMSSAQWESHWNEQGLTREVSWFVLRVMLLQIFLAPFIAIRGWLKSGDTRYLIGLAHPIVYFGLLLQVKSRVRLLHRLGNRSG